MEFQTVGQLNKDNKIVQAEWLSSVLNLSNDSVLVGENLKTIDSSFNNICGNNISCVNSSYNNITGFNNSVINTRFSKLDGFLLTCNNIKNCIVFGSEINLENPSNNLSDAYIACTIIGSRIIYEKHNVSYFAYINVVDLLDSVINKFITPYHPNEFIFGCYEGSNEISSLKDYLDTKADLSSIINIIKNDLESENSQLKDVILNLLNNNNS